MGAGTGLCNLIHEDEKKKKMKYYYITIIRSEVQKFSYPLLSFVNRHTCQTVKQKSRCLYKKIVSGIFPSMVKIPQLFLKKGDI